MRKLVLLVVSLLLCACTLQQGPGNLPNGQDQQEEKILAYDNELIDLANDSIYITNSLELSHLLTITDELSEVLFNDYLHRGSSPELWPIITKTNKVLTIDNVFVASVSRFSTVNESGNVDKYFFFKVHEVDGKMVMEEITNTNHQFVTDSMLAIFENKDEIIELHFLKEGYEKINDSYISVLRDGEGFLTDKHNLVVQEYQKQAQEGNTFPLRYVNVEPFYYYKDGTLTHIYVVADMGVGKYTAYYDLMETKYHEGRIDIRIPEDNKCLNVTLTAEPYTLCREGDTLYHTTK